MLSKLALDDSGMARCEDCGKLFEMREGSPSPMAQVFCRACARERGEVAIVQAIDPETLLREKTERLIALFNERGNVAGRAPRQVEGLLPPPGPVCVRCRKRATIDESDFCLACHLELDNVLGAASRDLLSRVELYEPPRRRVKGQSVMDSYGEKATEAAKNAVVPPHSQSPRAV